MKPCMAFIKLYNGQVAYLLNFYLLGRFREACQGLIFWPIHPSVCLTNKPVPRKWWAKSIQLWNGLDLEENSGSTHLFPTWLWAMLLMSSKCNTTARTAVSARIRSLWCPRPTSPLCPCVHQDLGMAISEQKKPSLAIMATEVNNTETRCRECIAKKFRFTPHACTT